MLRRRFQPDPCYPRYPQGRPQDSPWANREGESEGCFAAQSGPPETEESSKPPPPRKQRKSARTEAAEATGGAPRKKREAKGKPDADPTFRKRPADPEPSGEGNAKGDRGGSSSRNPKGTSFGWNLGKPTELAPSGTPPRASSEAARSRRIPGSGTGKRPRAPNGTREGSRKAFGPCRRPDGTDRGRKASAGTPPGTERSAPGQWGLAATPAPILFGQGDSHFSAPSFPTGSRSAEK